MRADVTITSGSISSASPNDFPSSIRMQGANFSLSVTALDPGAIPIGLDIKPNEASVTFVPSATINLSGGGQLIYNGIPTTLFSLQMNVNAAPVSAPNAMSGSASPTGDYSAKVSNVAFLMTGIVTIYSDYLGGTVAHVVPISGTGIYSAGGAGDFLALGPGAAPAGSVTYEFMNDSGYTRDTTTLGAWSSSYGGDGYLIADGASQIPSYASVNFAGASTYTWVPSTSDGRALQNGIDAGAGNGIASAYFGNYGENFSINLNLSDGKLHRVALYLLDWDSSSRVETITISDTTTHAVIDTKTFSGFANGEYAVWNLQGNVTIEVARVSGGDAVVSGIFFGPSGTPPLTPSPAGATADFEGVNVATSGFSIGGNWSEAYGISGYSIPGGSSVPSAYGQVSFQGGFPYTWAPLTSDARAPQTSSGSSSHSATAYTNYAGSAFSIDVNVTGSAAHAVSLYLLDWDTNAREETITVRDASTQALLSSVTFSNFHAGEYVTWYIQGNVVMTVTPVGATSPVVSGVFF